MKLLALSTTLSFAPQADRRAGECVVADGAQPVAVPVAQQSQCEAGQAGVRLRHRQPAVARRLGGRLVRLTTAHTLGLGCGAAAEVLVIVCC